MQWTLTIIFFKYIYKYKFWTYFNNIVLKILDKYTYEHFMGVRKWLHLKFKQIIERCTHIMRGLITSVYVVQSANICYFFKIFQIHRYIPLINLRLSVILYNKCLQNMENIVLFFSFVCMTSRLVEWVVYYDLCPNSFTSCQCIAPLKLHRIYTERVSSRIMPHMWLSSCTS